MYALAAKNKLPTVVQTSTSKNEKQPVNPSCVKVTQVFEETSIAGSSSSSASVDAAVKELNGSLSFAPEVDLSNLSLNDTSSSSDSTSRSLTRLTGRELDRVRFSQSSISFMTSDQIPLFTRLRNCQTLMDIMHVEGWDERYPVTLVEMPIGFTTLDNRRMAVAKVIQKTCSSSITAMAQVQKHFDHLTPEMKRRMSREIANVRHIEFPLSIIGGSFGEAITSRVIGDRLDDEGMLPKENYLYYGFDELPIIRTPEGRRRISVLSGNLKLLRT